MSKAVIEFKGCRRGINGTYLIIFGLAVAFTLILPARIMVFILTALLIIVGILTAINC